jgi:hypothetical protein
MGVYRRKLARKTDSLVIQNLIVKTYSLATRNSVVKNNLLQTLKFDSEN